MDENEAHFELQKHCGRIWKGLQGVAGGVVRKMEVMVVVIVIIIFIVIPRLYAEHKKTLTTCTVKGKIKDCCTMKDHKSWTIEFQVEGRWYNITIQALGASRFSMRKHVGEEVTVHYDPSNPKRAWAEVPSLTIYS